MISLRRLLKIGCYALLTFALVLTAALTLLRWEAGRSREDWFDSRQGQLRSAAIEPLDATALRSSTSVRLASDSGLRVSFRVIRNATAERRLPVLLVLGGHRTGSSAVEFFDAAERWAVVALDYPYDGPQRLRGVAEWFHAIPLIRRAFLDIPPAISLAVDWLSEQPWVNPDEIVMVGVSLGVPFAATAAARDERLRELVLIHGAADNRRWLELNIGRRMDFGPLEPVMATLAHWLAYGPVFDTAERIAAVSPRPVIIVGARDDERMPEGQTELLFEAAREPKILALDRRRSRGSWPGGRDRGTSADRGRGTAAARSAGPPARRRRQWEALIRRRPEAVSNPAPRAGRGITAHDECRQIIGGPKRHALSVH